MSSREDTSPGFSSEESSQVDPPATAEELRQELAFVCEAVSVALVLTTSEGTILRVDPEAQRVFRQSEIIGKNIQDLDIQIEPQDVKEVLARLRTEETVWGYPARLLGASLVRRDEESADEQARRADEHCILWVFDAAQGLTPGFTDELTGLVDRELFLDRTERAIARCIRSEGPLALLYVDVEDFGAVNEQFGHAVGDALLVEIAIRLREVVRETISDRWSQDRPSRRAERAVGTVARIAGDRFAFVVEECGKTKAERIGNKIRERLQVPFETSKGPVHLSGNMGIAIREPDPSSSPNAEELLRAAETALHQVKQQETRIRTFGSEDEVHAGRLDRREDLRRAIDEDQLTLHYQPVLDLEDRSVVGVEALVRWEHPKDGLISPGQFIPLAETSGLIRDLDRWVLQEALRQVAEWRRSGGGPGRVSVNVTAPQKGEEKLQQEILGRLEKEDLPGEALTLELTERVAFRRDRPFETLRRHGVRLAIDDFGTGYSALFYLRQFEADVLKIDQAFVQNLDAPDQPDVLVRASLEIAEELGMEALAEGIETEAQLRRLREMGCPLGQGYLFARPMPPEELAGLDYSL